MPSLKWRVAQHTILFVGEGKTECAFLSHIMSLYISRGCGVSVKIRNAHGKGSDHVVDYAIRQCRNSDFDRVVVLLDSDMAMSASVRRRARSKKIQMIESNPCLEGLLLKILGRHVPATSELCKKQTGHALPARLTTQVDYGADFPMDIMEDRRKHVPELGKLLDCLSFD